MTKLFSCLALDWLERTLLPLALKTADLPPETTLADLAAMNLPLVKSSQFAEYQNTEATTMCSQNVYFCSVMLAAELAGTQAAEQIARCIYGLMWRDATNHSLAKDLDMFVGEHLSQAEGQRCDLYYANWDRWVATEALARQLQADFISDCAEERLWSPEDPG